MNALITALALLVCVAVISVLPEQGATALLWCAPLGIICCAFISRVKDDRVLLFRVFVASLAIRIALSAIISLLNLHNYFGPDAFTYDEIGFDLQQRWENYGFEFNFGDIRTPNYGMGFMVALIYSFTGRNLLAVQFTNAVFGSATAAAIYLCARQIFENKRVARLSLFCVAFYPSLILWSSQGLKDAPIVFFIAMVMLATLKLGERLRFDYMTVLVLGLTGILAMRFYVFYMAVAAVTSALLIGTRQMAGVSVLRQFTIVLMLGIALAYMGVRQTATSQFETFANLEAVQRTRTGLAQGAGSGYGAEADVSTASGALTAIPTSMVYLLFAPFPWQLTNVRQAITLPEMLVWWGMCPLLVLGLWFTIKYRLRQAFAILVFTTLLTLAYSIFQGNIGAAYRQRSQLLIFYFIFVAAGYVLLKEHSEEKQRHRASDREQRQLAILKAHPNKGESRPKAERP